jgi:hypothetical protein
VKSLVFFVLCCRIYAGPELVSIQAYLKALKWATTNVSPHRPLVPEVSGPGKDHGEA